MNILKKWKKSVIVMLTALMLSGSIAVPVMAHHHGNGSSHGCGYGYSQKQCNSGYDCPYHNKTHKKKSSCKKYCKKHKTVHKNGKQHRVNKQYHFRIHC